VEKFGSFRQATDDNLIRRMSFARWITKATNTHSEYVILITFPLQQWLCECASMLRYKYTVCFVPVKNSRTKILSFLLVTVNFYINPSSFLSVQLV